MRRIYHQAWSTRSKQKGAHALGALKFGSLRTEQIFVPIFPWNIQKCPLPQSTKVQVQVVDDKKML